MSVTSISKFFFYSWHKLLLNKRNPQLKIKVIDHSRNERDESISPRKLEGKKSEKLPVKHCSDKDNWLLCLAMNWNELGTRWWGIPKGKYLTAPPPHPASFLIRVIGFSMMQHLLTLAFKSRAKKKRQTFTVVIINVKEEGVQCINIWSSTEKLTNNRGEGRTLI